MNVFHYELSCFCLYEENNQILKMYIVLAFVLLFLEPIITFHGLFWCYPWFSDWNLYNRKYHGRHFFKVKLYGRWYILIFVEAGVTILVCHGFLRTSGVFVGLCWIIQYYIWLFPGSVLWDFCISLLSFPLLATNIGYPWYNCQIIVSKKL